MSSLVQKIVSSPVGALRLVASDDALVGLHFERDRDPGEAAREVSSHPILERAQAELAAYFGGGLREFRTPLLAQGTAFQQEVWSALAAIPFGERWSYAQLAREVGHPKAVRAVGAANGRNPLPIFLPCHRVIGSDGGLTGYGGGLGVKRWLLDHEQRAEGTGLLAVAGRAARAR